MKQRRCISQVNKLNTFITNSVYYILFFTFSMKESNMKTFIDLASLVTNTTLQNSHFYNNYFTNIALHNLNSLIQNLLNSYKYMVNYVPLCQHLLVPNADYKLISYYFTQIVLKNRISHRSVSGKERRANEYMK